MKNKELIDSIKGLIISHSAAMTGDSLEISLNDVDVISKEIVEMFEKPIEGKLLGTATKLSQYGYLYLCDEDKQGLLVHLPCTVYESDTLSDVDGSKLLKFDWMTNEDQYFHEDFVVIELS